LLLRRRRNRAGRPGSVDRDHHEVAGTGDVDVGADEVEAVIVDATLGEEAF
jgi:hypothetical protein